MVCFLTCSGRPQYTNIFSNIDTILDDMLSLLFSYSLAHRRKVEDEPSFDIHPLVHLWGHKRLNLFECTSITLGALELLTRAIGNTSEFDSSRYKRLIIEHIRNALRNVNKYLNIELYSRDTAADLRLLSYVLHEHRRFDDAEAFHLH
jgi:hypothetical protein